MCVGVRKQGKRRRREEQKNTSRRSVPWGLCRSTREVIGVLRRKLVSNGDYVTPRIIHYQHFSSLLPRPKLNVDRLRFHKTSLNSPFILRISSFLGLPPVITISIQLRNDGAQPSYIQHSYHMFLCYPWNSWNSWKFRFPYHTTPHTRRT